jgi:hypothetical protein
MGTGLKYQTRRHPPVPGPGNAQKLATLLQPQHVGRLDVDRHGQAGKPRSVTPSRRKAFPPLGAAGGKNPAAADSRHATAKSMPTFSDNIAWLKSTLHGARLRQIRARCIRFCTDEVNAAGNHPGTQQNRGLGGCFLVPLECRWRHHQFSLTYCLPADHRLAVAEHGWFTLKLVQPANFPFYRIGIGSPSR